MTGKELVESVRQLGFDSDVTSQSRLFSIITLALRICAVRFPRIYTKIYSVSGDIDGFTVMLGDLEGISELDRVPLALNGRAYHSYTLLSDRIMLDGRVSGELAVRYRRAIEAIDTDTVEEELPLCEGAHHLAILLTAYLYWQEDEPEKASEYLKRYENEALSLSRTLVSDVKPAVGSVNNW